MSAPQPPYTDTPADRPPLRLVHDAQAAGIAAEFSPARHPVWFSPAHERPMLRLLYRAPDGTLGQCTFSSTYCGSGPEFIAARLGLMDSLARHYASLGFEVLAIERLHTAEIEL